MSLHTITINTKNVWDYFSCALPRVGMTYSILLQTFTTHAPPYCFYKISFNLFYLYL